MEDEMDALNIPGAREEGKSLNQMAPNRQRFLLISCDYVRLQQLSREDRIRKTEEEKKKEKKKKAQETLKDRQERRDASRKERQKEIDHANTSKGLADATSKINLLETQIVKYKNDKKNLRTKMNELKDKFKSKNKALKDENKDLRDEIISLRQQLTNTREMLTINEPENVGNRKRKIGSNGNISRVPLKNIRLMKQRKKS